MGNFDLQDRALQFALRVDQYIPSLPRNIPNIEHGRQLSRSGGSVGANYIEANEALGTKDFKMRLRIARKEAKESLHWLQLTLASDKQSEKEALMQEATELVKILSAIINKAKD